MCGCSPTECSVGEEVPPAPISTADVWIHILAQEFAHAQGSVRL